MAILLLFLCVFAYYNRIKGDFAMYNVTVIENKVIPIFFAADNNYMPYLDVAISSLIEHANKDNIYQIYVLNTGLDETYKNMIQSQEKDNVKIKFFDMSYYVDSIKDRFVEILHFSMASYYRLFIQNLFPQYKKVLYLDCDIVVLRDVAELYNIDLEGNMLAGAVEQFVANIDEYSNYARFALGLDASKYINSGILVMDLEKFRQNKIEQKFTYLISNFNFELVDYDQAYLNFLCKNQIKILPSGWNKTNYRSDYEGELSIVHFALAEKPWQSDVNNGNYFWDYAKKSKFYDIIKRNREQFTEEDREKKRKAEFNLRRKAVEITNSENNIYKKIVLGLIENSILKNNEAY